MPVILFLLLTYPQTQPYLGRVNGDVLGAQHYISIGLCCFLPLSIVHTKGSGSAVV